MHGRGGRAEQAGHLRSAAEPVDDFVSIGFHAPQYAIVGSLSQAKTSDIRGCDNRKGVAYGSMAAKADLRPEAAAIFQRMDALGLKQRHLAGALGIEENKVSKVKAGERQFQGPELLKALDWLEQRERESARATNPDQPPTRSADGGEAVEITALDLSLAMGPGTIIDDFVESEPVIFDAAQLRRITRSPFTRLRVVTGIGTSHEPKFHSSDQFLIDINERQLSKIDGYYWITWEGAHALKRLRPMGGGRIQIISENPDFEPIVADAKEVRIEGRAVWVARGL